MRLDDERTEALLAGRSPTASGDPEGLAAALEDIRSLAHGPVPPPSPALAEMLADGFPETRQLVHSSHPGEKEQVLGGHNRWSRRSLAIKASLAAAAVVALAIAGTFDVLPGPAQRMVATAIGAVTPFELPDHADQTDPDAPGSDADRADGVATIPGGRRSKTPPSSRVGVTASTQTTVAPVPPGAARPDEGLAPPRATTSITGAPGPSVPVGPAPLTSAPVTTKPPTPTQSPGATGRPADRWKANLSGALVSPGPGDPDGGGTVSIEVDAAAGRLCATIALSAVAPPTAVHLQQAPRGQTGSVTANLLPSAEGGSAPVCVPVGPDLVKNLREDPAGFYIEVHTRDFPDGALRGQLSV